MAHVTLTFTVLGKPRPAGSKRAIPIKRGGVFTGKVAVKDDSTHGKPWRDSVAYAAQEAMSEGDHELLTGPLGLGLTFYVARPASHYTKAQHKISRGAPRRPVTRPDLTKYVRASRTHDNDHVARRCADSDSGGAKVLRVTGAV